MINDKLNHIGGRDSKELRQSVLNRHRPIAYALSADYVDVARRNGYIKADQRLKHLDNELFLGDQANRLYPSATEKEIKQWCSDRAHECETQFLRFYEVDADAAMLGAKDFVESQGLEFPLDMQGRKTEDDKKLAWIEATARLFDHKWWRRRVRTALNRKLESVARDIRLVHADRGLYCSDICLANRKRQKKRNADLLESLEAEDQDGNIFTLSELAAAGLSNPRNRFSELVVRAKGFDQIAEMFGHEGRCFTLTCPSRFHCMIKGRNGRKCFRNKSFYENEERLTPRDAQDWLCRNWDNIRAKFSREEIRYYGYRVVEPHHDGCPHWHMSLYFNPDQADQAESIIREWSLKDSPDEKGAEEKRVDSFVIDPEQGATGYLVKYLTKNIDGAEGMDGELDYESSEQQSLEIDQTQARVEAWASCWGIRQFQVLGGPSVTVWRELRKLNPEQLEEIQQCLPECEQLEDREAVDLNAIRQAADSADWAAFVLLMGGVMVPKASYKLQAWRLAKPEENQYFEVVEQIKGVCFGLKNILTRFKVWEIRPKRRESEKAAQSAASWTRVNNCTGSDFFNEEIEGIWAYG
ncbi:replication endonuclease [Endozoicomonas montiporae]|uniref:Replication protein A n=1 Tax=Endozoicomonas montiporae CL-33 TaxID=570277 RepID=A0A142BCZ2_9GAMM|nr:replication endonuclease [Endozoicomonas montiporae]AMO56618.1 replication protein A [Endozoicomonas montiporae CL-33]